MLKGKSKFLIYILVIAVAGSLILSINKTLRVKYLREEQHLLKEELNKTREKHSSISEELVRTKEELQMSKNRLDELENPKDGVNFHGQLSVNGGRLVNQRGESIQLRGVSTHGIMWFPEFGNYSAIKTIKDYGANMMRIAMYTTQEKGYDQNPIESKRTLRTILENVLAADMYAIVDWHVLYDQDPNLYVEEAKEFFGEISYLYKDDPGVIYEICNEPNGDTTWEDIRRYAGQVIPIIRANSPKAVIIVGTPDYSSDIQSAYEHPLEYENIMYALHFYAEFVELHPETSFEQRFPKDFPVFVSEWGIGVKGTPEEESRWFDYCVEFADYMQKESISWAAWSLSNAMQGHSMIRSDSPVLGEWDYEDLTVFGRLIFSRLSDGTH